MAGWIRNQIKQGYQRSNLKRSVDDMREFGRTGVPPGLRNLGERNKPKVRSHHTKVNPLVWEATKSSEFNKVMISSADAPEYIKAFSRKVDSNFNILDTRVSNVDRRLTGVIKHINGSQQTREKNRQDRIRAEKLAEGASQYDGGGVSYGGGRNAGSGSRRQPGSAGLGVGLGDIALGGAAGVAAMRSATVKALAKKVFNLPWKSIAGSAGRGSAVVGGAVGALGIGAALAYLMSNEKKISDSIKDIKDALARGDKVGAANSLTTAKSKLGAATGRESLAASQEFKSLMDNSSTPAPVSKEATVLWVKSKFQGDTTNEGRMATITTFSNKLDELNVSNSEKQRLIGSLGGAATNLYDKIQSRKKRNTRRLTPGEDIARAVKGLPDPGARKRIDPDEMSARVKTLEGLPDPGARKRIDPDEMSARVKTLEGRMNLGGPKSSGGKDPSNMWSQFAGSKINPPLPQKAPRQHGGIPRETAKQYDDYQQMSQFMKFGALPRGFEHVMGNRGILGKPVAVAASGAQPFGGGGGGGYGGGNGGGSSVGSYTPPMKLGGPIVTGGLAAATGENVSGDLKAIRARQAIEMQDPKTRKAVFARMEIEVGSQGPEAQQAYLESTQNRAASRGLSLYDAVSNTSKHRFYPSKDDGKWARMASAGSTQLENKFSAMSKSVDGASNTSKWATGNASLTVGFGQGKARMVNGKMVAPGQTSSFGGERFGVEAADIKFMRKLRESHEATRRATASGTAGSQSARNNVNQSTQAWMAGKGIEGTSPGTIDFEKRKYKGTTLHDTGFGTAKEQLAWMSGKHKQGNKNRLGYSALIDKEGNVVETANPNQLTSHTRTVEGQESTNQNFTSIGIVGGFNKKAMQKAIDSGQLAQFFAARPGSLEEMNTHADRIKATGTEHANHGDRKRLGYHGGAGEAAPQKNFIMQNMATLKSQVAKIRAGGGDGRTWNKDQLAKANESRAEQIGGKITFAGVPGASFDAGTGGRGKASMPYGYHSAKTQLAGPRLGTKFENLSRGSGVDLGSGVGGRPDVVNLGNQGRETAMYDRREGRDRTQIQAHPALGVAMSETNIKKLVSSGCLAVTPDQYKNFISTYRKYSKDNNGKVWMKFLPSAPGQPHQFAFTNVPPPNIMTADVAASNYIRSGDVQPGTAQLRQRQVESMSTEDRMDYIRTQQAVPQEPTLQTAVKGDPAALKGILRRGAKMGGIGPIGRKTFQGYCGKGARGVTGALLNDRYFAQGLGGRNGSAANLSDNNNYLQKSGFYKDREMVNKKLMSDKKYLASLPIGTVISNKGGNKGHGHVQVKLANGKWASDALQDTVLTTGNYHTYAVHRPNAKGFQKMNPAVIGMHPGTMAAMNGEGIKVGKPSPQNVQAFMNEFTATNVDKDEQAMLAQATSTMHGSFSKTTQQGFTGPTAANDALKRMRGGHDMDFKTWQKTQKTSRRIGSQSDDDGSGSGGVLWGAKSDPTGMNGYDAEGLGADREVIAAQQGFRKSINGPDAGKYVYSGITPPQIQPPQRKPVTSVPAEPKKPLSWFQQTSNMIRSGASYIGNVIGNTVKDIDTPIGELNNRDGTGGVVTSDPTGMDGYAPVRSDRSESQQITDSMDTEQAIDAKEIAGGAAENEDARRAAKEKPGKKKPGGGGGSVRNTPEREEPSTGSSGYGGSGRCWV